MRKTALLFALVFMLCLTSCASDSTVKESTQLTQLSETQTQSYTQENSTEEQEENTMELVIKGGHFTAQLEANDTVEEFLKLLPTELEMKELNGNEKYCYLDCSLPSKPENVHSIKAGDIMLYGDSCIVIFYKSFSTQFSYTKIGHIETDVSLDTLLGDGTVSVNFQK